ncbi:hypothetical protein BOTBODRAFT_121968 [Botryobasidium botryosum FD-172 SS1]|uniref:DUF7137 domain-containing protein n=1 Tax=Botryobasidium botryosum (strain FD-172 SS1) TaxID=930990 RepID=A0A067M2D2_BOTB1|nr:hypothetical protein BOTBODRAFT_121968 [Botryobasidium botryosum FD-172 SS1]
MSASVPPATQTASVSGSSASGSATGTGTSTGSSVSGTNTATSNSTIPQTAAAGVLVWTKPPSTATPSFYKLAPNQPITFGWNLSSLYSTPASLTISAFCPDNSNTYPVTTIPGTQSQITWDPYAQQNQPGALQFAQATYTMLVADERGMGVGQKPGLLSPNSQLRFALYQPPPYTPFPSWTCPGCSSASKLAAHPALLGILVTMVVMMISGWRILRR